MKKYSKAVVAIVVSVIAAVVAAVGGGGFDAHSWVNVGLLLTSAAAVYVAPNVPGAQYTKVVLAGLGALVTALVSVHAGGFSTEELIQVALAVVGAVGVYQVKNVTNSGVNLSYTGSVGEGV